jgi:DNA-binding Xre family transcriptional regulator
VKGVRFGTPEAICAALDCEPGALPGFVAEQGRVRSPR